MDILVIFNIFVMKEIDDAVIVLVRYKALQALQGGIYIKKAQFGIVGNMILPAQHIHKTAFADQFIGGIKTQASATADK